MRLSYLGCHDIPDGKRLRKVFKVMRVLRGTTKAKREEVRSQKSE
jgi:hypothetical protein